MLNLFFFPRPFCRSLTSIREESEGKSNRAQYIHIAKSAGVAVGAMLAYYFVLRRLPGRVVAVF